MKGLTKKQKEILTFIQTHIASHQYSPSYREIMMHFGFQSLGSVHKHLTTLKRKGAITAEKHCSRSIVPLTQTEFNQTASETQIPLVGEVSAGFPLELFADIQTISVPTAFIHLPENTYALRAKGSTLQEEHILHGDLLLIEARQIAQPGDMILGFLHSRDVIIKKYFPEGNYVTLSSHSSHFETMLIRLEDLSIQGILIAVLRHYG